jgi:NAD(P)-dependent dehydrogenase (short-subunit alcohol dehydrogenase family)
MKLSNKTVLVTGGTSGIGLEAAKLFREEGATVIIVGQNPDRLQCVASQLGDGVTVLRGDVGKPAALESIIKQISEKFGRIDVLFANAGMGLASPLEAVTEDQIDRQFDVNFKGVFFAIQKVAPLLAKGGSIIVTTSFLSELGVPGLSILSATKAAVRSLVRSLGAEFAPRGIRVNAVSPGLISTPFHGKLGLSEKQLNEAASAILNRVPLHRFGEAGEIAKAALFLASDDSSFMTGSELVVDGGLTQI